MQYWVVDGIAPKQTVCFSGGSTTNEVIPGLDAATNYSIEVSAVNSAGIGKYSPAINVTTRGINFIVIPHTTCGNILSEYYITIYKTTKYTMSHISCYRKYVFSCLLQITDICIGSAGWVVCMS